MGTVSEQAREALKALVEIAQGTTNAPTVDAGDDAVEAFDASGGDDA